MVGEMIATAYERDRARPEIRAVLELSRESRKYGFPISCTLADSTEQDRLAAAARLLLSRANTWPAADIPVNWVPIFGTALYDDARQLLEISISNTLELQL